MPRHGWRGNRRGVGRLLRAGVWHSRPVGFRRARVMSVVLGLVVLCGLVWAGVGLSDGALATKTDGPRLAAPAGSTASRDRELVARRRYLARMRARRRAWLASPGMRAQRKASQMAFHGLAGGAAQRLLLRDFGSVLAGGSANPVASIEHAGHIVRYLSDYSALVRTRHGLEVETSTVPLRVRDGNGGKLPIDLGLG